MDTIFCFGDGFATGHLWPEWPQILQALLPNYTVITTAGIGAGDEFLVSGFVDHVPNSNNCWPRSKHNSLSKSIMAQHRINNAKVYKL